MQSHKLLVLSFHTKPIKFSSMPLHRKAQQKVHVSVIRDVAYGAQFGQVS